jgi:hypothetical protein
MNVVSDLGSALTVAVVSGKTPLKWSWWNDRFNHRVNPNFSFKK